MAVRIGRNINTNPIATTTVVTLNNATATKIADANPDRISLEVHVDGVMGNNSIFIKPQPAAIDNIKAGYWTGKQGVAFKTSWPMSTDNIYTGEVSAIVSGNDIDVMVMEY